MKKFSIYLGFLIFGIFSVIIRAQIQWDTQIAQGLTVFSDPMTIFSAVDHNICWGIEYYELGNGITNPKFAITTNGGSNWSVASALIPSGSGVEAIYARDAQTAWIAVFNPTNGADRGIYNTTDGGVSWNKQGSAFTGGGHPLIIYFYNKSDTGICVGAPRNNRFEVYTTIDGGTNWTLVQTTNMPAADPGDLFPTGGTGSGNTFLFGTFLRKVYRSTDRGTTWTKINYNAAPSGAGIGIQLKDDLNGIAATYFGDHINRVAKTSDGGQTWSSQPLPPSHPSFYFISYVPGTSAMYFVTSHNNYSWNDEVTTPGSMFTQDSGKTWSQIDSKPHGAASFSDDGWGWSGGIGDTIYRISRDALPVGVREFTVNAELPENFSLEQNYPNPFNPSTKIKYSIPTSEFVTLKVYDVLGNEVATLLNEDKPAGSYSVEINAANLSSGIYFYRMQTKNSIETKKMILLR